MKTDVQNIFNYMIRF